MLKEIDIWLGSEEEDAIFLQKKISAEQSFR